ncbi:MAG TPA: hypothetical protein DCG57_13570 [Candidatus Riflebacteria bacterium]|nr:hypothetical protein [Candidatus Riflebacteria bacterium]
MFMAPVPVRQSIKRSLCIYEILTLRLIICKIFVKQTSSSDDRVHGFVCLLIFRAGLTGLFFAKNLHQHRGHNFLKKLVV